MDALADMVPRKNTYFDTRGSWCNIIYIYYIMHDVVVGRNVKVL